MGGPGILRQCGRNGEQDEAESHAVYDIPQRVEWGGGVCMASGAKTFSDWGLGIRDWQNSLRRIRALFVFGDAIFLAGDWGRGARSENRVDHACQTTRPAVWLSG